MDSKLGLELEILAYRKLLEGEENRDGLRQIVETISTNQQQRSSQAAQMAYSYQTSSLSSSSSAAAAGSSAGGTLGYGVGGGGGAYGVGGGAGGIGGGYGGSAADSSTRVSQVTKGEMSAKTTYQRSAKGPVSISECSADGKFIAIENTGRKEEELHGWKLRRNIDGLDKGEFSLDYVVVQPMSKIRVWAHGSKPVTAPPTDLEYFDSNWGIGSNITTKLVNQIGEDRATHMQKTVYA